MSGLRCGFCGLDTPHGCWTAEEAAGCGNLTDDAAKRVKAQAKSATEALEIRERRSRRPTPAEVEKAERKELARLKAKYERG